MEEERKRVLVVGGTGYLGQRLLQAFSNLPQYDVAFTHHSTSPPQPLLHALPGSLYFRVDLKTGHGFHSISHHFRQVSTLKFTSLCFNVHLGFVNYNLFNFKNSASCGGELCGVVRATCLRDGS